MKLTRIEQFKIYIDWFVTRRAWLLTHKPFNYPKTYSFDEFLNVKTGQTSMYLVDEWNWKFNIIK